MPAPGAADALRKHAAGDIGQMGQHLRVQPHAIGVSVEGREPHLHLHNCRAARSNAIVHGMPMFNCYV